MRKLVTISREYGSGGRLIGKVVAEMLGVPFYDKEIIDMAVEQSGLSREVIETAELRAKNSISYSLASAMMAGDGFSPGPISINEKLFNFGYHLSKFNCHHRTKMLINILTNKSIYDIHNYSVFNTPYKILIESFSKALK